MHVHILTFALHIMQTALVPTLRPYWLSIAHYTLSWAALGTIAFCLSDLECRESVTDILH